MFVFMLLIGLGDPLPTIVMRVDDTQIRESCRIEIPPDTVIEDANDDGVIQITAGNIVVEFAEGAALRGAKTGVIPSDYRGYAIRIDGQSGVTLRGVRAGGFRGGIWATNADGLVVENADFADLRRDRLKSTPVAEDAGDWLWPHQNDAQEWRKNYGAAICIEDSKAATVRAGRVRASQNGLILDRVTGAKVYDNDFSFLSGWGVAMWRSSGNVISRNALDFCVRGYSHGVYNRGQDSAGILVFEQCRDNVFAENSATHGGDGFFGFAGREALGEAQPPTADFDYKRRGCNDNLLIGNDFSYAPAHGIELTFSFGNQYIGNRLVGNAICGVWGGYSQDTLISANAIETNGEMAYGLERGGVNIEHGRGNRVIGNSFRGNRCGVHFWWDEEGDFLARPWGKVNGSASTANLIAGNTFERDELVFHFRGAGDVVVGQNTVRDAKREMQADEAHRINREDVTLPMAETPKYAVYGEKRPVGARPELRGRENIIMTEWQPWDHAAPLVRLIEARGAGATYQLHKVPGEPMARVEGANIEGRWDGAVLNGDGKYVVSATLPGVHSYTLHVSGADFDRTIRGTIVSAPWDVTFFSWKEGNGKGDSVDPREKLDAWRALASGPRAVQVRADRLMLKYSGGGPKNLKLSDTLTQSEIGPDHFGMIARTVLPLERGKWRITTTSDDGVRVSVDGKALIDNWTWHGPTRDHGIMELDTARTVEIVVEHFEIDGHAVLEFDIAAEP